jgi:hypothetical protein
MARSLPPVRTLGELNREPHWLWVNCARSQCGHKAAMALAPGAALPISEAARELTAVEAAP